MKTSNQFKNICRKLRNGSRSVPINKGNKLKSSNCYDCLACDNIEYISFQGDEIDNASISTKTRLHASCLPEDMIILILQYLPIDMRLKILKHKYNSKIMQLKLQNMSKTDIQKLFEYASTAEEVLRVVLKKDSDILTKLSTFTTNWFREEKQIKKYLCFYKEKFTEIILAAMKYYTKIYKKITSPTRLLYSYTIGDDVYSVYGTSRKTPDNHNTKVIEEMMFRLYAKIILI